MFSFLPLLLLIIFLFNSCLSYYLSFWRPPPLIISRVLLVLLFVLHIFIPILSWYVWLPTSSIINHSPIHVCPIICPSGVLLLRSLGSYWSYYLSYSRFIPILSWYVWLPTSSIINHSPIHVCPIICPSGVLLLRSLGSYWSYYLSYSRFIPILSWYAGFLLYHQSLSCRKLLEMHCDDGWIKYIQSER